jgi:hypothetical protein
VVPVTTEHVLTSGDLAEADGLRGYDAVHLAAALAGQATVVATAETQILAAAPHRQLDVSNPLEPQLLSEYVRRCTSPKPSGGLHTLRAALLGRRVVA